MRNKYNMISAVLIVIILAASVLIYCIDDREGPIIEIPENGFTYTEGADLSGLLAGVKAHDTHDGDVSDTLIVENLIPLSNGATAKVTYAAQDKEFHITKKSFIINYIGKDNNKLSKDLTPTGIPSEKTVNKVNSQSNSSKVSPTVLPKKVKEKPVIKLNTREVILVRGSKFDPLKYVKEITDNKDERDDIYTRIHVEGYYRMRIPGNYILEYYVIDSDKNKSAPAFLKLIVTE